MFILYPLASINFIYMAAAVVPAIILLKYIYELDEVEHEPKSLLGRLLIGGMACIIPAIALEWLANMIIGPGNSRFHYFIEAFFGVALIEEGCKFFALKKISFDAPSFDYRFDGIVYAVFVSLGFAILENVKYVYLGGISTAFVRALTSIPGHMSFAIPMGIFFANAKRKQLAHRPYTLDFAIGLVLSIIFHGIYDYVLMVNDNMSFILVVIVIYLILFTLTLVEKKDEHL
ncbi:MAG: PrsW family intramembrane metalloprotease [Intestinibaculum porci]|jgi:RsiW-degrading membrane proteinase PrsW (M82 family)|uniref:PrsW family intramembrane metalloprotease n=1 Tax=Intestinibaculum porci TaxID=2487118 RepID=UPI003EFBE882